MKKMRKMFMAIMMVVVSVTMLSTASFAWFAMSREVSATKMDVSVTTPGDIKILVDHVEVGAFTSAGGASAEAVDPQKTLAPVSSADGLKFFYVASSNVATNGTVKKTTYLPYNEGNMQTSYGYAGTVVGYIDFQFTVYNGTEKSVTLTPSMTFTNTSYKNAMRAAIFDGGATTNVIYLGAGVGAKAEAIDSESTTKAFSGTSSNITLASKAINKITIRIWIEGGEDNVTTKNFTTAGDFQYVATFKIAD